MTVVRFKADDIIVASGGSVRSNTVMLSKFNDQNRDNNAFSFGGNTYVIGKNDNDAFKSFRSDLSNYVGDPGLDTKKANEIYFGDRTFFGIYHSIGNGINVQIPLKQHADSDRTACCSASRGTE